MRYAHFLCFAMRYLVLSDYRSYIQAQYFNELVQGDDSKRTAAESQALAIVKGHLQQKYDVDNEFTDTATWSNGLVYHARDRVVIDFPVYDTTKTYTLNSLVVYAGFGYINITAVTVAENFNHAKWTKIASVNTIFYAKYPAVCTYQPSLADKDAPVFNYKRVYNAGDVVYWKGKTYTCARSTALISHDELINSYTYANVPHYNVFPDDTINNSAGQYWNNDASYSIPSGTLPTDTTYWVEGDNRDAQIVLYMLWIVVDILSPLIAPMNCPELWKERADRAVYEIENMAKGMITADIALLQPDKGKRIRYGGNVKRTNWY
jgi:hypothetical protein